MQFERLFTPIQIRNKTARNRIVFPCHATRFPFFRDEATPEQYTQYIDYLRARASGGCQLAVIGSVHVHWSSKCMGQLTPPTPEILAPKLRQMADALHEHGTLVVAQINAFRKYQRYHRSHTSQLGIYCSSFSGWQGRSLP